MSYEKLSRPRGTMSCKTDETAAGDPRHCYCCVALVPLRELTVGAFRSAIRRWPREVILRDEEVYPTAPLGLSKILMPLKPLSYVVLGYDCMAVYYCVVSIE